MMSLIKNKYLIIAGVAVGALAGFLYWNYIGCVTGTCAITSNPYNSTIYGAVMGGLLFSSFKKENKKPKQIEENDI